jgi:hypothetical protein
MKKRTHFKNLLSLFTVCFVILTVNSATGAGATGPTGPTGPTGAAGATGATGAGYLATSTSSVAIGTGTKTFTTQSGLAYLPGDYVRVSSGASDYIEGTVTSYSGTTLVISEVAKAGTGTFASWNIGIAGKAGAKGVAGATGIPGTQGPTGAAGATGATGVTGPTGFVANGATAGNTPYWNGSTWIVNSSNIFNDGGNVGISNSTPTTLFEVGNGGTVGKVSVNSQDNGTGQIQVGNPASGGEASIGFISGDSIFGHTPVSKNGTQYIWDIGAGNYGLPGSSFGIGNLSYGGAIVAITSTGNVGIGNTAPNTLLQVGSGGTTGKAAIYSQDNNHGQLQIGNPASNGEASMEFISGVSNFGDAPSSLNGASHLWTAGVGQYGNNGDFIIGNDSISGPAVKINPIGQVAMAQKGQTLTIAPGFTLAVNGGIITSQINVELVTNWPDYVFDREYHLPSLAEVKNTISNEGHLPGMPSKAEVEKSKSGVNIGDMQEKLLSKVEELTLYVLQQQEEIEKLKANNDDLNCKLEGNK